MKSALQVGPAKDETCRIDYFVINLSNKLPTNMKNEQ